MRSLVNNAQRHAQDYITLIDEDREVVYIYFFIYYYYYAFSFLSFADFSVLHRSYDDLRINASAVNQTSVTHHVMLGRLPW